MNFYLLGKTPDPSIDISLLHKFKKKENAKKNSFVLKNLKGSLFHLYLQICKNLL